MVNEINIEKILMCLIFVIIGYLLTMILSRYNDNRFIVSSTSPDTYHCPNLTSSECDPINREDIKYCIDFESGSRGKCEWNNTINKCQCIQST